MQPIYKRILLKLSGEVLAGDKGHGFDFDTIGAVCSAVKKLNEMGVEVGLVVGGGNFWRGRPAAIWIGPVPTISVCSLQS